MSSIVTDLRAVRGMHHVTCEMQTQWVQHDCTCHVGKPAGEHAEDCNIRITGYGHSAPNGWRKLIFRGTDRAVHGGRNLLMLSGLQELDPNADHDHAACVESARKMGVPAAWAHTPETYLSM